MDASLPLGHESQPKVRHIEVIRGLGRGGAERLLYSRLQRQYSEETQTPEECLVLSTAPSHREYENPLREVGIQVWNARTDKHLLGAIEMLARLRRSDIDRQVPIVCHSPSPSLILKVAHFLGVLKNPIIDVVHNEQFRQPLQTANSFANRWASFALPVSIAVSTGPTCRNYSAKKVIYGGIAPFIPTPGLASIRQALDIPMGSAIVLTVGRLTPAKGQTDLIRAVAHDKTDTIHLVILGEGEERQSLTEEARSRGISHRVHVTGFMNNPMQWMEECDLYCQPSRWEGLPVVLMEAQSRGCIIVTTDVGGAREVMTDPLFGQMVPAGQPTILWKAIEQQLGNRTLQRRRAIQAASGRWSIDRYVAEMATTVGAFSAEKNKQVAEKTPEGR